MSRHPTADAISGLSNVNRHVVEIAQRIDSDGIGQLPNCCSSELEIGGQRISESTNIDLRLSRDGPAMLPDRLLLEDC